LSTTRNKSIKLDYQEYSVRYTLHTLLDNIKQLAAQEHAVTKRNSKSMMYAKTKTGTGYFLGLLDEVDAGKGLGMERNKSAFSC